MKKVLLVVIALFSGMALAQLQPTRLSGRAQNVASKLSTVEQSLSPRDFEEVRYALDRLEMVLANYQDVAPQQFLCLSNGQSGSWEKFYIYDYSSKKKIGGETSKATCESSLRGIRNSLVCASNGQSGSWEKFSPHDLRLSATLGGETAYDTCVQLVTKSKLQIMCVSNGQSGSWEKFSLYDRINKQTLGGETSLESCLASFR